jgi:Mg-chelatase subunit ChlD
MIDVAVTTGAGTQWKGLGASDFSVQVGGRPASVTTVRKIDDRYLIEMVPPTQSAAGVYDLVVSTHGQTATQSAALRYAAAGSNRVDVMLILDRSGSMAGQPLRDARNAAVLFVDLMTTGDAIGVGSYSTSSRVDYPLTAITDSSIKNAASAAIGAIDDGGYTSIGAGLVTGRDQLLARGDDNHPWAIVLLSDGQENTAPYVASVLPTITATKIKVFSIGLGDVDESLMSRIAAETGGSYYLTPDSTELARIYNSIAGQVAGRQTLYTVDGTVTTGQTTSHTILVDPSVTEAIFSVSWDNPSDDLNLTLTQPDGRRIDAAVAASDPNIDFVSGATYEYFLVRTPQSGNWLLEVMGIRTAVASDTTAAPNTASAGEAYTLSVQGTTRLTLETTTDSTQYGAGDPIQLLVSLADTAALPNAQVRAIVTRPNSEIDNLELLDDGNHNDNVAGDGVYGALYHRTDLAGTYRFDISAAGQSNGQSFTRETELSVVVNQASDADHDGMPDEWEYWSGLDPLRNDSGEDPDTDGLTNLSEYRNGAEPWFPDTDIDGLLDGQEVNDYHSNPRLADTDLGGVNDGEEVARGTNPLDPSDDNHMNSGRLFLPVALVIPYIPPTLPLLNGNFEAGPVDWTQSSSHNWPMIVNSDQVEGLPTHSGIWIAWLGGDDDETSTIEQTVTVPPDRPWLTYYHGIASEDACGYDFGRVLVDGAVVEQYTLCRSNNTPDWAYRVVNLSAYAGQTVALQFRATTDGSLNSNLLIDDVAFNSATTVRAAPVPFRWPAGMTR